MNCPNGDPSSACAFKNSISSAGLEVYWFVFLSELKEQTRKEINRLLDSKVVLENERLIYLKSETRVNEMINELRKMRDNDSFGSFP